jgi:hypothetical protein
MRNIIIPSEECEQKIVADWLDCLQTAIKDREIRYYAIPNGGLRNKIVAARLKATGTKRGVPDLCLPVPSGGLPGLYVEMKKAKGGALSPEQKDWINFLRRNGYAAEICAGAESAKITILEYLGLSKDYLNPFAAGNRPLYRNNRFLY